VEANARLERRVGELLAVAEAAQGLASELHLDVLREVAVSTIASLTGAHAVSLLLTEPGERRFAERRGRGLAGWVAEHQVPLLLADVAAQPEFALLARAEGLEGGSFLGAPLLFQERLVGVACAAHKAGGLAFDDRDLRLLVCLAPHLAIAVRNATLYEGMAQRGFLGPLGPLGVPRRKGRKGPKGHQGPKGLRSSTPSFIHSSPADASAKA
jgi:GAF domain-containing protein